MPVDLDGDGKEDKVHSLNVIGMVAGGECEFIDAIKVRHNVDLMVAMYYKVKKQCFGVCER